MNDDQLLRYSRHILLDDLGVEGQQRLLDSHALIVGAGGLGSPVAMYLAASGVGHITIADHDVVDLTNLQRQIAHTTERVGMSKVASATQAMQALNPEVRVSALAHKLDATELDALVPTVQVVVDCCDNFATRQAVNAACVKHRVPLVSGAAIRMDSQLAVYDARDAKSPCYACIFPPDEAPEEVRCATLGVLAPLVGVIGSLQAMETVKLLAGLGSRLTGRLQMLDGRSLEWNEVRLQRNPSCPVCSHAH
ncbi:molybdopterin biosynthesis protein MoeB [Limnohabitans sp. JirII-29]|uniref:HesA/MoeB/ThiF family protein n=1 Tax=unclassified Limnohabitans TaxID=2626134 RepID=UPI000C1E675B|nr:MULTISPECIES: molybdopterin-synthase adenylyltransferase MoeB [unclassified Limnohabitans]PIT79149.1 molybdopterin biosynthesis protein MoeB [Limnohabitans sp. JirII-31]PUE25283.1 molybdopterin biosynthesis protein MoeB [Limnohabitans sp. JirII-29]